MNGLTPFRLALSVASIAALISCGGSGSVTTTGGGQGPSLTLPMESERPEPETSLAQAEAGEPVSRVTDFLLDFATRSTRLGRFATSPVVRIVEGTGERERALTIYAVALINRVLPYDQHLTFGPDAPPGVAGQWRESLPGVPDGEIFVEFTPGKTNAADPNSGAVAHLSSESEYNTDRERWEYKEIRAAGVEVVREYFRDWNDRVAMRVLLHEFGHVLGLEGHPDRERFSPTVMNSIDLEIDGALPSIDTAALQALYTRLGEVTFPEDLSAASLGPWARDTLHITGALGDVAFGVSHRNGISVPWTEGIEPSSALADNDRLSGTVTWTGSLLGFTSEEQGVTGEAAISVNLATLTGRADFIGLEQWPEADQETGNQWNTGSLGYTIAVGENYLRSTGGDDGIVHGAFYGRGHEGVAGSVERPDLTAAFGAVR